MLSSTMSRTFLTAVRERYLDLAEETTGSRPKLHHRDTPFLHEDHRHGPSGGPCAPEGTPAVYCPHCCNHFPIEGNQEDPKLKKTTNIKPTTTHDSCEACAAKTKKKFKDKVGSKLQQRSGLTKSKDSSGEPESGQLQSIAAKVLMKILYGARMARFDLLRAVCHLACFVTKWTSECDRRLHRLMCYIASTKHYRQCGWVGDDLANISVHLFADADFAGCTATERSTGGMHLNIMGPNTCFPLAGASRRHGATSCSTPEAELVSAHIAMRMMGLYQLWIYGTTCSLRRRSCTFTRTTKL